MVQEDPQEDEIHRGKERKERKHEKQCCPKTQDSISSLIIQSEGQILIKHDHLSSGAFKSSINNKVSKYPRGRLVDASVQMNYLVLKTSCTRSSCTEDFPP